MGGVILLATFVWWQTRTPHPLLPPRVVADRNRDASYLAVLIASAGMFGVSLFLTYYLQQSLGYSPVKTGLAFLPMVAMMVATSITAQNVLAPRFGPRPIVPLGMALVAAAIAWLTALDLTRTYAVHDTASWRSAAFFAAGLLITVILYRSGPLSAQTAATRAVPTGEEESGNAPVKPGR